MMRQAMVLLVLAALVLSGCTDKLSLSGIASEDEPFELAPLKGDGKTSFHVATQASGDVTWDFGDGKTANGASADHVYGFTNGVVTITMIATAADGKQSIATRTVTLGTGNNAKPTVSLSFSSSWVEVRKNVTLTGRGYDSDRDPLTYLWTYRIISGGVASDGHDHAHDSGADKPNDEFVLDGSTNTNSVTFDAPGKYAVKVRVRDPKGAEATSEGTIDVSKHIPASFFEAKYNGTLVAGTGGQASASEQLWGTPAPDTFVDAARYPYKLAYPATTIVILTWNDTTAQATGQGVFDLDLELRNTDTGKVVFASQTRAPAAPFEFNYTSQEPGNYEVLVRGITGAQVTYNLFVRANLYITPELVAKAEGG